MAKRDLFNPLHRFQYQYSWFNVQNESQYARLRKRWFYALYGDSGPSLLHPVFGVGGPGAAPAAGAGGPVPAGGGVPAAGAVPAGGGAPAAAPAPPVTLWDDYAAAAAAAGFHGARYLGYFRIPLFTLNYTLAAHSDPNEDEARLGTLHRPHLGILDMIDPIILLSSLRIAMAHGLARLADQLEMDGKMGAAAIVKAIKGIQKIVLGIPLGLISTITALLLVVPKAIIAGILSRILTVFTLPFLKEDTSLPVDLPQDEEHPEIIAEEDFQNRKARRAATKEIKKNIDTLTKEKSNKQSTLYGGNSFFKNKGLHSKGLPKEMIVNIVKHTAEMPDDGGLTAEEVAWNLVGGAPRPGRR